ncbi:hypothetical protein D9615_005733 [Tricholomella constricta]|uniref:Uncharacterized protein n=1 Tax=Tricholomella constricta TaxID=117010 RepID=A0A8H5HAD1_9AGAR|nr:hypothetical protein D9615_005733 [Tricholomella constricta]
MHLIKTISTKSLRSTHIVIDFKALHENYDLDFRSADFNHFPEPASPTKRTLRRKKRVSLLRTSSPPLSRPQSTSTSSSCADTLPAPKLNAYTNNNRLSAPILEPNNLTHNRSKSQPANHVRLGHPSRPYYSAIRPNMSRPTSPIDSPGARSLSPPPSPQASRLRPVSLPTPARAPSPGIFSVLSSTSALSEEDEESPFESFAFRPRSASAHNDIHPRPFAFGSLSRRTGAGFSLSGETELRMALARELADEDAYKFKDMGKRRGRARVMRKVRELKKGLKGLVTGKS